MKTLTSFFAALSLVVVTAACGTPEGESQPENSPATEPSANPEGEPSANPEGEPSANPEGEPSANPEGEPSANPEGEPSANPEGEPSTNPEGEPSTNPEGEPSANPEGEPSANPEGEPSANPEPESEPEAMLEACEEAILLEDGMRGTTVGRPSQFELACDSGNEGGGDIVYRFELTETRSVNIDVLADDTDAVDLTVALFSDCIDLVVCSDAPENLEYEDEGLSYPSLPAGSYTLVVDTKLYDNVDRAEGAFTISFSTGEPTCLGDHYSSDNNLDWPPHFSPTNQTSERLTTNTRYFTYGAAPLSICGPQDRDYMVFEHMGGTLEIDVFGVNDSNRPDFEIFEVTADDIVPHLWMKDWVRGADIISGTSLPRGNYALRVSDPTFGASGTDYGFNVVHECPGDRQDWAEVSLDEDPGVIDNSEIVYRKRRALDNMVMCPGDVDLAVIEPLSNGPLLVRINNGASFDISVTNLDAEQLLTAAEYSNSVDGDDRVILIPNAQDNIKYMVKFIDGGAGRTLYSVDVDFPNALVPTNNKCSTATEIVANGGPISGDTTYATHDATGAISSRGWNDAPCNGDHLASNSVLGNAPDVFYKLHLEEDGDVRLTFDGWPFDDGYYSFTAAISIYEFEDEVCPDEVNTLPALPITSTNCAIGVEREIDIPQMEKGDYLIVVDGLYEGNRYNPGLGFLEEELSFGDFTLEVEQFPGTFPMDGSCAVATDLPTPTAGAPVTFTVAHDEDNVFHQDSSADCGGRGAERSFIFVPTVSGTYQFTAGLGQFDFDTVVYVRDGCEGTELVCNDDISDNERGSRVEFDAEAGQEYFLFVDAYFNYTGDASLTAEAVLELAE